MADMKQHFFLFPLFTIILLTSVGFSYAQTVNENHEEPDLGDIIPEDSTVGPVGIVNELEQGHSIITDIMSTTLASISNEEYVDEEIFYEAAYVDYENERLVVWLDPAQRYDPVAEDDILEDLGLLIPIEIKYGVFIPGSAPSEATACPAESDSLLCYYWGRYVDRCLPERTTSRCTTYTTLITGSGYAVPTLLDGTVPDFDNDGIGDNVDQCITQPETINGYQDTDGCPDTVPITPVSTTAPAGSVIFSDDFENGLDKWTESGQREWQTGIPDDNRYIPDYPSSNLVAEADDCDDEACILTLDTAIDLTKYSSATLELWRFVDAGLDRNEYLSIQLGNNGAYTEIFHWTHGSGDDHLWHKETYNLSSYLSSASFTIRILTEQSKSSEDVAVDKINIIGEAKEDVSECTLNVTAQLQGDDILVSWNDCGEDIRRYKVYPVDNDPRSGYSSVYSGTSYTYTRGQEGHTYSFDVRAQYDSSRSYSQTGYFHSNQVTIPESDRTAPVISTPGNLSHNADSNDGAIVDHVVTAYDSIDGTVPVSCSPSSGSLFEVGDTVVTCTASDAAGNVASKSFTVTVIAPAVDTEQSGRPSPNTNNPSTGQTMEFYGGNHYVMEMKNSTHIREILGTLTVGVRNSTGIDGIVTAAHNAELPPNNTLVAHKVGNNKIKITSDDALRSYGPLVDAAFIPITEPNIVVGSKVQALNGTVFDVVQGSLSDLDRFQTLSIYGIFNNGDGKLLFKNATIYARTVISEMDVATYASQKGDSGSPIIYHSGGDSTLVGVHHGGLCAFESPSEGQTFTNVTNTVNCIGNHAYYKTFSAWENVRSALNLE